MNHMALWQVFPGSVHVDTNLMEVSHLRVRCESVVHEEGAGTCVAEVSTDDARR